MNLLNNLNTYNQNHIALLRRKPLKAKLVQTKNKTRTKEKNTNVTEKYNTIPHGMEQYCRPDRYKDVIM